MHLFKLSTIRNPKGKNNEAFSSTRRVPFSTNTVEVRYHYKLIALRCTLIIFSFIFLFLGLNDTFNLQSEYLETILNFSKTDSNNIIKLVFFSIGVIGTLLGSFF